MKLISGFTLVFGLTLFWLHLICPSVSSAATPPTPGTSTVPINQVLASVGARAITGREVRIQSILESVIEGGGAPILDFSIGPDQTAFQKGLTKVLLEWMVYLEAQAFSMAQVGTPEIESTQRVALSKMSEGEKKLWTRLGVSDRELTSYVERKLRAKRFLEFKTKTSAVIATDVDAQKYFEKNRRKFGEQPFEKFKDNIKIMLSNAESEERLREWFTLLKRKYRVRYVSTTQGS
ncbi:MAG: hypothetical protein K2X47_00780 [Bdellovibrionales bacterium]|nr:hypothetical protein [Bdellovibrionales bacterium]